MEYQWKSSVSSQKTSTSSESPEEFPSSSKSRKEYPPIAFSSDIDKIPCLSHFCSATLKNIKEWILHRKQRHFYDPVMGSPSCILHFNRPPPDMKKSMEYHCDPHIITQYGKIFVAKARRLPSAGEDESLLIWQFKIWCLCETDEAEAFTYKVQLIVSPGKEWTREEDYILVLEETQQVDSVRNYHFSDNSWDDNRVLTFSADLLPAYDASFPQHLCQLTLRVEIISSDFE